jgi:hypothetical protein
MEEGKDDQTRERERERERIRGEERANDRHLFDREDRSAVLT